jgi:F-type H+-transporting ATPase subunit delta
MKEQITAKSYAKSIMELGDSSKIDVATELLNFNLLINECNDLENVLYLDLFTFEEKQSVLNEVINKSKLSSLMSHFLSFLLQEKRLNLLPLIWKEVTIIDDDRRGFLKGVVYGSEESISNSDKELLEKYLTSKLQKKASLEYEQSKSITAGFRVTLDDLQLDASIDNQLDQLKSSILGE